MATDSKLDIVEESLEPTEAVQSDVLGRRLELVLDVVSLGRLEGNVVARDSQNPVADVAFLVLAFVEEEAEAGLGIRPFGGSNGDRYVVGGIGGGRAGINPDPDNDGTRNILLVGFVGDETSDVNGRVANLLGVDQVTNSPPDGVERGTVNTSNRFERGIGLG